MRLVTHHHAGITLDHRPGRLVGLTLQASAHNASGMLVLAERSGRNLQGCCQ